MNIIDHASETVTCPITGYVYPDHIQYLSYKDRFRNVANRVQAACDATAFHRRDLQDLTIERIVTANAIQAGLWLAPDGSWCHGTRQQNRIVTHAQVRNLAILAWRQAPDGAITPSGEWTTKAEADKRFGS